MSEQSKFGDGRRYEFLDNLASDAGVQHSYKTVKEATEAAAKIDLRKLQEVNQEGQVQHQVVKTGNVWHRETDADKEDVVRLERLLQASRYQQVKDMLERAQAADQANVPVVEPHEPHERTVEGAAWEKARSADRIEERPLTNAEFKTLGDAIEDVARVDTEAARQAASKAGMALNEFREPPLTTGELRKAYLEGQIENLDRRAIAARSIEEEQRAIDPDKASEAISARKNAEHELYRAMVVREAEDLPEEKREAFRAQRGVGIEAGTAIDVAERVRQSEDRQLELSEAAEAQFARYDRGEIPYSEVQATDDLAQGYEINRRIAYARGQEILHKEGKLSTAELEADEEAQTGREEAAALERARQRKIERDEERGELEAAQTADRPDGNTLEDFDALAGMQARHQVPKEVEAQFPSREAGKARTHYYAQDTRRVAFVDKGDKMQSPRDFDQQGVRAMVDIAKARGWEDVKVRGAESFRRQVYLEAAKRGIEVKGYTPTEAEKAVAEKDKAKHQHNKEMANAFREADTPNEKAEAARQYGHELRKAYAAEAALRAYHQKIGASAQTREAMQAAFHKSIEADLRAGRQVPNVQVYERKRNQKQEAQAEQVR